MRGCQRKIILLKGTDSQIFDEAYFLLRRESEDRGQEEIVREAQRIIDRNTTRRRRHHLSRRDVIAFAIGAVCGIVCGLLLSLL